VVLGGADAALALAERTLAMQNARCTQLRVGIASHTPWMRDAAVDFLQSLSGLNFHAPHTALFSNADDRVRDAAGAKHALAAQIADTVRWDQCMENIRARNVACVLEIGPGQALARIWNARYPDVPARSCDEFRSPAGIAKWLAALCQPSAM
jgi:[acyl-carrier-protein] S-malonyltransferase